METLKILIDKKETTTKQVEIEIQLPAFYKKESEKKYWKITREGEGYEFRFKGKYVFQDKLDMKHEIKTILEEQTPIEEAEFNEALKQYLEKVHLFAFELGFTSDGLPLPTPQDFGLDESEPLTGAKMENDVNV